MSSSYLQFLARRDIEGLMGSENLEVVKETLLRSDILQYFFPAPDHLALGLIDRTRIRNTSQLEKQISESPNLGHPFGQTEIAKVNQSITDIIDELKQRKLIVDGEVGLEISPEGQVIRQTIRFKPREGILSKLINRVSVNIDLKSLFGIGQ